MQSDVYDWLVGLSFDSEAGVCAQSLTEASLVDLSHVESIVKILTHPICRMSKSSDKTHFIIPNHNYWLNLCSLERNALVAGIADNDAWFAPQHVGWLKRENTKSVITFGIEKRVQRFENSQFISPVLGIRGNVARYMHRQNVQAAVH